MFKIESLAASETSNLHLRNGVDELLFDENGKPLTITVYGPGSKAYAKAAARQQNKAIEKLKRKGKIDQTAEEKAAEQAEFLAAVTVSFNNFAYGEGLTGVDMFRSAYADTSIGFIAEQVGKHVGDWSNFTNGSAKS